MKSQTARTMVILSTVLLLLGGMISPSAGLLLVVLAALSAIPTLFASTGYRIAGLLLIVLSVAFAFNLYPKFRADQKRYMDRVKKNTAVQPQMSTTTALPKK